MTEHEAIISVEQLSKHYHLGSRDGTEPYITFREAVVRKVRGILRPDSDETDGSSFWALQDLSFSVGRGDVLGIVGRNGAGKSTLLKILSRITPPTSGTISLRGRVASLLEVGTGFHPELSGRENIYLNGAILGMKRHEIRTKFDEIVSFAEIERFLDLPIKRYSSGMYVRLAFAVAAHLDPDILVVDEVLAVGDAAFQKKCLGKMQGVAQSGERTVLLVSHNVGHLTSICNKALWLKQGRLAMHGDCNPVISRYLSDDSERSGERVFEEHKAGVRLKAARIRNSEGLTSAVLDVREPFSIGIDFETDASLSSFDLSIRVVNSAGVPIFSSNRSRFLGEDLVSGPHASVISIPGEFLIPDQYTLTIGGFRIGGEVFFVEEGCLTFQVEETGSHMARFTTGGARIGVVLVHFPWTETAPQ